MRNPLTRRYPRELRNNIGKYLGLLLMMAFAVSFTSGFLLAAGSIESIVVEMDDAYRIEDGRFTCDFEADDDVVGAVEALGVKVHENFAKEVPLDIGSPSTDGADAVTARVYANRTEVDLAAYAQGSAPEGPDEIALDRVFMSNHGLSLGDEVGIGDRAYSICGVMTLPDYQALFEDNASFMFNALTFTVAQVSQEAFDTLGDAGELFTYSYVFEDRSLDIAARSDVEEDMIDALSDHDASVNDLIDAADNQGIGYALDDVRGDQAMWTVLLFMLVAIMAFVFVVLTGATIEAESAVIGTMLASGWRKRELVRHYMLLPTLVGLAAVAVGLAIGLTALSDPMKDLYYNSYSLPPYEMRWNWRVVGITAVVPFAMLVLITLWGLLRKLRFTPLQFLRHEVAARKRRGGMQLPASLRYASRFRIRVLLRNASHFITLFFGIMFASLLLLFGTCLLPVVDNFAKELEKTVPSSYQYVLKTPVELEGSEADRDRYAAALRILEDHERIEANQDAVDAAERLEDNDELMDALERLQDNQALVDALERLEDRQDVLDAAERLEDEQDVVEAAERLQSKEGIVNAARRLQGKSKLVAAAQRLQEKQELVAAAQRLQKKQKLVKAAQRLAKKGKVLAAAQRAAAGEATEKDMALLASLDARTQKDLKLLQGADAQTRRDLETVQDMDAQTRRDLETVQDMDAQTRRDLETVENMDEQTRRDMETVQGMSSQTRRDMELLADLDAQTRDDLELLEDADAQTRDDLDLLSDLDQKTRDDVELVRGMDEDLLDDLRLASEIDEDAHVVNTQANGEKTIAQAEKFAVSSVEIERLFGGQFEDVKVYGIQPDSRYWSAIPVRDGAPVASRGLLEKTKAEVGSPVAMHDRRSGKDYELVCAAEASNEADVSLYMSIADFNRLFDNDADYFNAYASDEELKVDARYVGSVVTPSDMTKVSDQMADSMGSISGMMLLMAVPIYLILVYLLTKTVLDRSARSISYMKVFGYKNREVDGLYVRPMTYAVLFSLVASLPLILALLTTLLKTVFMSYAGNFPIIIPPSRFVMIVAIGMVAYALVAFLHIRRVRRVPLALALKVQE